MDFWWSLQPVVWLISIAFGALGGRYGVKRGWSLGKTLLLSVPVLVLMMALNHLLARALSAP